MRVERVGDLVQVTLDATEAATLGAVLDFMASPASGYAAHSGVRALRPLVAALCEAYGLPEAMR